MGNIKQGGVPGVWGGGFGPNILSLLVLIGIRLGLKLGCDNKLIFQASKGKCDVLCLETSSLGTYYGTNYKLNVKFRSHYCVAPDNVLCVDVTQIEILLGLDAA